jgi:hypothetical protein
MLNAEITTARITLFEQSSEIKRDKKAAILAGKYPLLNGSIEIGPFNKKPGEKYPTLQVAAFKVVGHDFLSLSIKHQEKQGDEWVVLQEFRGSLNKGSTDSKYFGYIHEQIVVEANGEKYYEDGDWSLGFNATGHPRVVENGEVTKKFYIKGEGFWNSTKPDSTQVAEEFPELDY